MFHPAEKKASDGATPTALFYGSFLNLQGPEIIVEAARKYSGPPVLWKLLGKGPLLDSCRKRAQGLGNVEFLPWTSYDELPTIIRQADILLGIFGATKKAGRVIPNKVYQALACGRPLITRTAPAYPDSFKNNGTLGIGWVKAGNPQLLANEVARLLSDSESLAEMGSQARQTYETYFSMTSISTALFNAIAPLILPRRETDSAPYNR